MRKISLLFFSLVLTCIFIATPAMATDTSSLDNAQHLQNLNLLQGSPSGFELERQPTRMEGLVMLLRLLGSEEAALTEKASHPFQDVPEWATDYAGYAYTYGITKGQSDDTFGAKNALTLEQYLTFVLRSLGYDDDAGDFSWRDAVSKSVEIGLLTEKQAANLEQGSFIRGDMVTISYAALEQSLKGQKIKLVDKLISEKVFTRELAVAEGISPSASLPAPVAPTLKKNTYIVGDDITVTWQESPTALSYEIYLNQDDGTEVITVVEQNQYTLTNLSSGDYSVQIYAVNESGAAAGGSVSFTVEPPDLTETNTSVAERLDHYIELHPPGGRETNCYTFAKAVAEYVFGKVPNGISYHGNTTADANTVVIGRYGEYTDSCGPTTNVSTGIVGEVDGPVTEENMGVLFAQARPGDIIQVISPGERQHTMIFHDLVDGGVEVYHGNVNGTIAISVYPYSTFVNTWGHVVTLYRLDNYDETNH